MGIFMALLFIVYVGVSIGIVMGVYALTKSKVVRTIFIAFFILLPTWDLIIQKGVKTYYQLFEMEPKIYAMPEFDEDGKIESLGLGDVTSEPIGVFKKYEKYPIYDKINKFIEFTTLDNNLVKILIRNRHYKFIDKQTSRYQIVSSKVSTHLFGLYQKKIFRLIDTKEDNKVLAEAFAIHFTHKFEWFRKNILFWQSGTGRGLASIKDIDNLEEFTKKIFKVYIRTNTNKGWK